MDTDKTVAATCEACGEPAEYDSELILCDECIKKAEALHKHDNLHRMQERPR